MNKILEVKDLKIKIEGKTILENVSFNLKEGEVLVIIGPNGAGKSMLLKAIIGIVEEYEGEIILKKGVKIGYLPQRFNIDTYLPLTVSEFLKLKPHNENGLKETINLIGIPENWLNKSLSSFSSGQLQKILLAWTLLDKPQLLLFDEPTENVDIISRESIYKLLENLQKKLNLTMIIVSHDLSFVFKYATNVLCLNSKMICFGPPLEELNEKTLNELYKNYSPFKHHHEN
jgi:zinc transport system ATP-binding protein